MVEKAISLYKSDFTEEQWEIICNEFDADTDGELKECAVVFTNNGSDFHLEPVKTVK